MTIDVSMKKEKEILARQWLANLKPLLGLDKDEKKTQPKHGVRGGKPSSKATSGVGKYADVSDDDDEDAVKGVKEGGGGDEKDAVSRHKDAFVKVWTRPFVLCVYVWHSAFSFHHFECDFSKRS